jgi:hypothetical protein
MSLKQKSRGSLLMVSEFLSEHAGRLRCSKAEAEVYAASHPGSRIAVKVAKGDAENGVEARLILEPGAAVGKDNYFDNDQLIEQTKLVMEVFDAMESERHVAWLRSIFLLDLPYISRNHFQPHRTLFPAIFPEI